MGCFITHVKYFFHKLTYLLVLPLFQQVRLMKTIQQDLRSNNLSLDEAITVAQNRPLWRLMSAFGAMHR